MPLTFTLEVVIGFGMTACNVAFGALIQSLIPDDYLGRMFGFSRSLAVLTIPIAAPAGGWLTAIHDFRVVGLRSKYTTSADDRPGCRRHSRSAG